MPFTAKKARIPGPGDRTVAHASEEPAPAATHAQERTPVTATFDGPQPHVFTIGYEGATLEPFVTTLLDHGVTSVVDVRYLPSSRKRGFSKTPLATALAEVGIGYEHVRALGTPTETRRARRDGMSWTEFEARYREHLRDQAEALETVAAWVRAAPVALLCFEADARACHRSIVAEALLDEGAAHDVVHLDVGRPAATRSSRRSGGRRASRGP
jgi:uncharacterized protein (DUF488 family)